MAILLTTMHVATSNKSEEAERLRQRDQELLTCLHNNLAHPYIEAVRVFLETKTPGDWGFLQGIEHEKLEIIEIHQRPFYSDMIAMANAWGEGVPGGRVGIIANGDIHFDAESDLDRAEAVQVNEFWTLSRYEPQPNGGWKLFHIATAGAHDCWIFRTPLPPFPSHYHLGVQGCDLIMAQRAIESGFKVLNPCLSVRPRHLHKVAKVRGGHKIGGKNYWDDPEYAPLGTQTYSPQPCSLEARRYLTRRSPLYVFMNTLGRWVLPLYRAKPIKQRIDRLRKALKKS